MGMVLFYYFTLDQDKASLGDVVLLGMSLGYWSAV
jgi:hypothetical protein